MEMIESMPTVEAIEELEDVREKVIQRKLYLQENATRNEVHEITDCDAFLLWIKKKRKELHDRAHRMRAAAVVKELFGQEGYEQFRVRIAQLDAQR